MNPNLIITSVAALLLLSSCVPHRPYRVEALPGQRYSKSTKSFEPEGVQHKQVPRNLGGTSNYSMAFIEFDDQGDKWAPKQTPQALQMIEQVRRRGKEPLLVLYIHGWKHNASPADHDVKTFETLLTELARQSSITKHHEICGVYIGWRGDVIPARAAMPTFGLSCVVRQLSIYNRMAAADRIANSIPFVQTMNHLAKTARGRDNKGKCVFMGHSLGARILETMATRSLLEMVEGTSKGEAGQVNNLADMVLLINPASDAQRARQTLLAVNWKVKALKGDYYVPAIISMRSQSDTATGNIYPLAMHVGKILRQTRLYPVGDPRSPDHSQAEYIRNPSAILDHMLSHKVVQTEAEVNQSEEAFDYNILKASKERFLLSHDGQKRAWWIDDLSIVTDNRIKPTPSLKLYDVEGKSTRGSYWVVEVPSDVLKGHGGEGADNGIFSPRMRELFAAFYSICAPAKNKPTGTSNLKSEADLKTVN